MSKLSKWIREIPVPEFNDYYSKHHDYNKRYDLYQNLIHSEQLNAIYYLEFGVARGHSFKWWVQNNIHKKSRFVGFDTFTGLPEDWGYFKKGEMSSEGKIPDIDDNRCMFIPGIFQKTLPSFLTNYHSDLRKVVHLDADIYSSTLYVLSMIAPYLKMGDILIFDEFNVPLHEFRAYSDFTSSFLIKTKLIGAVNNYYQVAFRIEETVK
jgi:hypothetical protein